MSSKENTENNIKLIIFVNDENIIQAQVISKDDPTQKAIILPYDIEVSNVKLWPKGIYGEVMGKKDDDTT